MGIDKILLALTLTGLATLANAAENPTANAREKPSTSTTTTTTTQQAKPSERPKNTTVVSPEDIKRFKAGDNSKTEVK